MYFHNFQYSISEIIEIFKRARMMNNDFIIISIGFQLLDTKEVTVELRIIQKVAQILPTLYLDTSPFITTTMITMKKTMVQRRVSDIIMKVNFIFQFSNFFVSLLIIVISFQFVGCKLFIVG